MCKAGVIQQQVTDVSQEHVQSKSREVSLRQG